MSSPSSSSSGIAGKRPPRSLRLPPRSSLFQWGAAAATAVALYGFPYCLAAAVAVGGFWIALLVADALLLAGVAVFLWSPLVVLAAAVVSSVFAAIFWFVVAASGTCGHSTAATVVELVGAVPIALGIGTRGVRQGPRALWAIPAGWVLAGLWIASWAHVIPGGAGGCFE